MSVAALKIREIGNVVLRALGHGKRNGLTPGADGDIRWICVGCDRDVCALIRGLKTTRYGGIGGKRCDAPRRDVNLVDDIFDLTFGKTGRGGDVASVGTKLAVDFSFDSRSIERDVGSGSSGTSPKLLEGGCQRGSRKERAAQYGKDAKDNDDCP